MLDGQPVGRTPVMVHINRSDNAVFSLELDGYDTVVVDRNKVPSGWFFGNLIFGGPIGIIVDLIAHNQGHYQEKPIYLELTPIISEKQAQK